MNTYNIFVPLGLSIAVLVASLVGCERGTVSVQMHSAAISKPTGAKVIFLAGPDSHLPGAHEHRAGTELLSNALRQRQPTFETVNIYGGWPTDETLFDGADALVMYCDGGDSHLIIDHLEAFDRLLAAGTGIVALHYCVEVPKDSPASASMQNAVGGYFETWWSVNPHWTADYTDLPNHPITQQIAPFTLLDEWYFNMRFVDRGVTPILSAIAPASTMERWNGPHSGNDAARRSVAKGETQVTAWAYERPSGGRGFGYTGGHFHANWQHPSARDLVLNAIEWVAIKP